MTNNERINAIKPLKSEFNKLSKLFDRILRYPENERKNIKSNRELKLWQISAKMGILFNEIRMIVNTPL